MQVFRLYFKILRQNIRSIMMYMIMFTVVFIAFTLYYKQDVSQQSYESTKVEIAVFDHDHSILSQGLTEMLNEKASIVDIEDDEEAIKDALFYDQIYYVITIPEGFEEHFDDGQLALQTQQKPDSANGYLIENYVSSYLNTVNNYRKTTNASFTEIHDYVQDDLHKQVDVDIYDQGEYIDQNEAFNRNLMMIFFNYLTYMFLAIVILTVGLIMTEINKREVRMRNIVSPIRLTSFNGQLILGNLCFCSAIWFVFILIIVVLCPMVLQTSAGYLYMLNSYIFMLVCLGLSYLISALFSNSKHADEALNAVANVVSLGSSFLCGAFVPQALLGKGVLIAASFTPAYWYIRFNNEVYELTSFDADVLRQLGGYLGIEILFAITFVVLAMVFTKSKRSSQEL